MENAQAIENSEAGAAGSDRPMPGDLFAVQRAQMAASQARVNDVTDLRLQHALRSLKRENFVDPGFVPLAYAEIEAESAGRKLLKPRDLAKLLQSLDIGTGGRALEVAGGASYGAAVLAMMGQNVSVLEHPTASDRAARAFEAQGLVPPEFLADAGLRTALAGRSFDTILVNGAVEFVPDEWLAALAEGGRLGMVVRDGPVGRARIYTKSGAATAFRTVFDAAPSLIQGFEKKPVFIF